MGFGPGGALVALAVVLIAFAALQVWIGGYQPASSFPTGQPASTCTVVAPARTVPRTTVSTSTATTVPTSTVGSATVRTADRLAEGAGVWDLDDRRLNPTPAPQLNGVGEVLLLGLAVLTVRSRVKH
jgi:hypothetical protein